MANYDPYSPRENFFYMWERDEKFRWKYVGLSWDETQELMRWQGVRLSGDDVVYLPNPRYSDFTMEQREHFMALWERHEMQRLQIVGMMAEKRFQPNQ